MAKFRQPNELDFTRPDQWPLWRTRFERYCVASKLSEESGEVQVNTLVYCLGPDAETVFTSFNLQGNDAKTLKTVLDKFTEYFIPKKNVIHERAMFNQRAQQPGESVEAFIRALHEMATHCEFTDKNDQIRDRLVVGLADRQVSRELQMKNNLTLNGAIAIARQSESVKAQLNEQQGKSLPVSAEEVRSKNARGKHRGVKSRNPSSRASGSGVQNPSQASSGATASGERNRITCKFCGKNHVADRLQCPARTVKCHKCHRRGHYAKFCPGNGYTNRNGVREVVYPDDEVQDESYFLGAVTAGSNSSDAPWQVKLHLCDSNVTFKIDSGADVCVMTDSAYKSLKNRPVLQPCYVNLTSVGTELQCLGTFSTEIQRKDVRYKVRMYVVAGAKNNLLSRSTSQAMGLIQLQLNEALVDSSVFGSIGLMKCDPVKIRLRPDCEPYSVHAARRVPIPLLPKVKAELERMEQEGVIECVTEPTEWVSPMVPVVKKNGSVRICVDLKRLNQAVLREKFILPTLDDVLSKLAGAQMFSSLDAASGFWAIPLDSESAKLTTFITPFGRYSFRRLPFGITSAPEIFQRVMFELLKDLDGVTVYMDDILIFGKSKSEHDERLKNVLSRIEASGLKLNKSKCKIGVTNIDFLGHHFSSNGVGTSADKLAAITALEAPKNVTELKRCLGMFNYLGRFAKNLASTLQPLNALLRHESAWSWGPAQVDAFKKAKRLLTTAPVLSYFDPGKVTVVSADASSYGIGACLMQVHGSELKPVAFASRSLSDAERRYAQIEKECLAAVWGCEKFSTYLIGLHFQLLTDHKPLVPLIMTKDIDRVPVRCQRLLLRLMRFDVEASHVPGKDLVVADTLSRSPLPVSYEEESTADEVESFVESVQLKGFSTIGLDAVRNATDADSELQEVMQFILSGWPDYAKDLPPPIRKYHELRSHLSVSAGLVLYDDRIFIPHIMQDEILSKLHAGHQGVSKCRKRARDTVYWRGISNDIKRVVESCQLCQEHQKKQRHEPLMPTPLPGRPWEKVGVDLFENLKFHFVLVTDYYSRYIEILRLEQLSSYHTIQRLKSVFARWGVPTTVVSDNGPQFSSSEFARFAQEYGFRHVTSSPHFPQSNGAAERAVQVAKSIVRQPDPFLGLMAYRATPHSATGFSPAQLVMGRQIRTTLPCLDRHLEPSWPNPELVRRNDSNAKANYKTYYDSRHGVRDLVPMSQGQNVYVRTDQEKTWGSGQVLHSAGTPRSSVIRTAGGTTIRRNNKHVRPAGNVDPPPARDNPSVPSSETPVRQDTLQSHASQNIVTRFGRVSKPADRLDL